MTSKSSNVHTAADLSTSSDSGPHSIMDVGKRHEASDPKINILTLTPNTERRESSGISLDESSQDPSVSYVKTSATSLSGLNAEDNHDTVAKDTPFTANKPPPLEVSYSIIY